MASWHCNPRIRFDWGSRPTDGVQHRRDDSDSDFLHNRRQSIFGHARCSTDGAGFDNAVSPGR